MEIAATPRIRTTGSTAVERIISSSRRPKTLGAGKPGAISLAMGEPDSGTPAAIIEAATTALASGRTRYAPMAGSAELQHALAAHTSAKYGRPTMSEEIVLTHGGSGGLATSMLALVNPGDRILIPEPTYSLYADHAAMIGAEAIWVPNLADGSLDLDTLQQQAPGARMIILCNPGNPTGRVYPDADLHRLEELLLDNPGLLLLADEAYADITFDGGGFTSALTLAAVRDQVICCSTFSKTYAMTGWRLGHVIAPAELASRINTIHRTINGPLSTFIQDAALSALQIPDADLQAATLSYQRRRDIVVEFLNGLPGVNMLTPQGAFYAFPKITSPLTSDEMTARFADAGVLVRSGSEFGPSGEGHIRISFATDVDSLKEGLTRFAATVKELA
ncbi:pyridoxal phosphate-dependent aminotransferase [Arthrobacter nitrophenolicus]|uniref:Pyridoxal phosphate-dependent aminotransferase n=1 Tax=Arthrobacter nitrophenolicus TaxID=683150 RepID=A0A4R5Y7A9_9MICC|nr:pyridoxal phosphate-dependent aminotransferase [Arthrobacter nitrophenolicus]TDL39666.1 pyridoxal phosphate-dependent aminotransferase [Arthrobacter nitrophenolicus]